VSRLRARCPDCRTLTAVALDIDYQCHSCGREFGAGLVRVPRAWGVGGEAMAAAAWLELPYPETGVVEEATLAEQSVALAADLPVRPLVLGGCCCSHVGAVEGLSARQETLAVIWIDAHGDLNTPASSPSGNAWGMPLRMLIDGGSVRAANVALLCARNLDPPEVEFIEASGIRTGADAVARALEGTAAAYVALDCDAVEPGELAVFMPEPDGIRLDALERVLRDIAGRTAVAGAGLTGLVAAESNEPKLAALVGALGL
jgi:arginase